MFAGPDWDNMLDSFEIQHFRTVSGNARENGSAERGISLLKSGFNRIRITLHRIGMKLAMAWACMSKILYRW